MLSDAGKLNSLVSLLRSTQVITRAILYDRLEDLGPELLAIVFSTTASYIAAVGLTAIIGPKGALAISIIASATVISIAASMTKEALWDALQNAYGNALKLRIPTQPLPSIPRDPWNPCHWYPAPGCYIEIR